MTAQSLTRAVDTALAAAYAPGRAGIFGAKGRAHDEGFTSPEKRPCRARGRTRASRRDRLRKHPGLRRHHPRLLREVGRLASRYRPSSNLQTERKPAPVERNDPGELARG